MSTWTRCSGGSVRPAPVAQAPLPPFDPSDSGGIVHTTPPPEWQPNGPSPLFFRTDFAGLTLDLTQWPGLTIPTLVGANTTPVTRLLSPMLILYPRAVQDAWLTEACWRGYTHIVIAPDGWNLQANGLTMTTQALTAWAQYCQSWGFYVVLWRSQITQPDPMFRALLQAGAVDFYVMGEEMNSQIPGAALPGLLTQALADAGSVPVGVHFTSNYPLGFPLDTYLTDWSPYNGRVHLCWQADQNDPAGTQGAKLYYARQRVQLGWIGDGTYSHPAPDCRVIAFEQQATAQLYGTCDEAYGCLRSLEMNYCPAGLPGIGMVSGFGNGGRYPNGSAI